MLAHLLPCYFRSLRSLWFSLRSNTPKLLIRCAHSEFGLDYCTLLWAMRSIAGKKRSFLLMYCDYSPEGAGQSFALLRNITRALRARVILRHILCYSRSGLLVLRPVNTPRLRLVELTDLNTSSPSLGRWTFASQKFIASTVSGVQY